MTYLPLNNSRYFYCSNSNTLFNAEIEHEYARYSPNRKLSIQDISIDKDTVLSNIKQLKQVIFEVTQDCNLDCKYCVFSSGEYYFRRRPSKDYLDFDSARKAIDLVYEHIKDRKKKEFVIGFYGGEPLLKFDVIKEIVDYSKSRLRDWSITFTITTNATIMNDKIIRFLVENHFKILVSLDGPKKNHDSKRVFHDGIGTFDTVIENLKKIKAFDEEYYRERVSFSVVYSKDLSLESVYNYFNTESLVKQNHLNLGFVTDTDTSYYSRNPYDVARLRKEWKRLFQRIVEKKKRGEPLNYLDISLTIEPSTLNDRLKSRHFNVLAGSCYFEDRLYVSSRGKFQICEKVNESFVLGDVNNGFDIPKMLDIISDYVNCIKEKCNDCEIRFLCLRCIANFAKDGQIRIEPEFCENNKASVNAMLEEIIQMNEAGGFD